MATKTEQTKPVEEPTAKVWTIEEVKAAQRGRAMSDKGLGMIGAGITVLALILATGFAAQLIVRALSGTL